ncbi:MAG: hypothetical protein P4M09_16765 [Devosia sp.]|nr:hypothetical protein [Devosia sp.]
MQLIAEWRAVLRHAWSVRLMLLAGLLSAAEAALGFIDPYGLPIPHGLFAVLAGLTSGAAFVARLIAQEKLK